MTTIAIVDYGMGNFHSVARALKYAAPDADIRICNQPHEIDAADRVVFPGQGAMADCMRTLNESGLREAVDTFFDGVMVMADDAALRDNRLALLAELHGLMNRVADISKLAA